MRKMMHIRAYAGHTPVRRLPYWHNDREMQSSTMDDVRAAVSEDEIPLDYGPWLTISDTGRDFIMRLLTVSSASPLALRGSRGSHPSRHPIVYPACAMRSLPCVCLKATGSSASGMQRRFSVMFRR